MVSIRFYINYEECKLSVINSLLLPNKSFILTMRNVNIFIDNAESVNKIVLY